MPNAASSPKAVHGSTPDAGLAVGGLTPLSATDYPGMLAAVVFCQGCPWRCGYCHNPHLIPRTQTGALSWSDTLRFLHRRRGLLDAVVFSGGEPTLQTGLAAAMRATKALGFKIGLHTGGGYPDRLAALLPLVDWVGMDVKTSFDRYADVTATPGSGARARESLALLLQSGVDYEVRTTVHPLHFDEAKLLALGETLADAGVRRYALQAFRAQGCDQPAFTAPADPVITPARRERLATRFERFEVRD